MTMLPAPVPSRLLRPAPRPAARRRAGSPGMLSIAEPTHPDPYDLYEPHMIVHQGVTLNFARVRQAGGIDPGLDRIHYRFHRQVADDTGLERWGPWKEVPFDVQDLAGHRVLGADLITLPVAAAAVDAAGDAPPQALRLAPTSCFCVVSTGGMVVLFRKSVRGTLYVNRFLVVQNAKSTGEGDAASAQDGGGSPEGEGDTVEEDVLLLPATEPRYRRSGNRDVPANESDTLGTTDMTGRLFLEPTQELLETVGTRFQVVVTPTSDPTLGGWCIVTDTPGTPVTPKTVTAVFYAMTADGLFSLAMPDGTPGRKVLTLPPTVTTGGTLLSVLPEALFTAGVYYEREVLPLTAADQAQSTRSVVKRAGRILFAIGCGMNLPSGHTALAVYDLRLLGDGSPLVTNPTGASSDAVATGLLMPLDGTIDGSGWVPDIRTGDSSFPVPASDVFSLAPTAANPLGTNSYGGYLLGQVSLGGTPVLVDSGDGLVHLYYQEAAVAPATYGALRAAQFDPQRASGTRSATWVGDGGRGTVRFTTLEGGSVYDQLGIKIEALAGPTAGFTDLGTLTVGLTDATGTTITDPTEIWYGVPLDTLGMLAALGASASNDPASADVQSGTRRFYDYTGARDVIRLPQQKTGATVPATGWLDLVSRRPRGAFAPFSYRAGAGTFDLVLTLRAMAGTVATDHVVTWPGLPTDVASAAAILRADIGVAGYDFDARSPGDSALFDLPTDGAPLLLCLGPASRYAVATATIELAPVPGQPSMLAVTVRTAPSDPAPLAYTVPRAVAGFIAALAPDFTMARLGEGGFAPPVWGSVVSPLPQTNLPGATPTNVVGVMTLRNAPILFAVLPPTSLDPLLGTLADYPVALTTPVVLQGRATLSGRTETMADRPLSMAGFQMQITGGSGRGGGIVQTSAATLDRMVASNGEWVWRASNKALQWADANHVWGCSVDDWSPLLPDSDLTIEAWVRPASTDPTRILSINQGAVIAGEIAPSAVMGLLPAQVLDLPVQTGATRYFATSTLAATNTEFSSPTFTIELWYKPAAGGAFNAQATKDTRAFLFHISTDARAKDPWLGLSVDSGYGLHLNALGASLADAAIGQISPARWNHVALVGMPADPGVTTFLCYVDGALVGTATQPFRADDFSVMVLGNASTYSAAPQTPAGTYQEFRYWNTARSPGQIARTMGQPLFGSELGLVAYWPLTNVTCNANTSSANNVAEFDDGTSIAGRALAGSVPGMFQASTFFADGMLSTIAFGAAGAPVSTGGLIPSGRWSHVAAALTLGSALAFNIDADKLADYTDFGRVLETEAGLFGGLSATLAFWMRIDAFNKRENALIGQWGKSSAKENQTFRLWLDSGRRVHAQVWLDIPKFKSLTIGGQTVEIADGFQRTLYDLTSAAVSTTDSHFVALSYDYAAVEVDKVMMMQGTIRLAVDSDAPIVKIVGPYAMEAIAPISTSTAPVTLGISYYDADLQQPAPSGEANGFRGVLAGLRTWTTDVIDAIMPAGIAPSSLAPAASWPFMERAGDTATDTVGGLTLKLSASDLWTAFPQASTARIFVDGIQRTSMALHSDAILPDYRSGRSEIVFAGWRDAAFAPMNGFVGQIEELRYWRAARTAFDILDAMHRSLEGYETGLAAYWPLHEDTGALVAPQLGFIAASATGSSPTIVDSNCPVGTEAPQVQLIYADAGAGPGDMAADVTGKVAAYEYAQTAYDPSGTPVADYRRGHVQVMAGPDLSDELQATQGFVVGEVETIFIGQGQMAPTLVGFIEGAPPVPSEDLNFGWWQSVVSIANYAGITQLELAGTDDYSIEGRVKRDITQNFTLTSRFVPKSIVELSVAGSYPAWIVIGNIDGLNIRWDALHQLRIDGKLDGGFLKGREKSLTSGWTSRSTYSALATGRWETGDNVRYPEFGRRFVPVNAGKAFVLSATVDIFALQLRGTGQMVGKVSMLSKDIPVDSAVIEFPMRSDYVKNGVLDGQVGFHLDPDFAAAPRNERSYFRPREAYALKARLRRKEASIKAGLDAWNASGYGTLLHHGGSDYVRGGLPFGEDRKQAVDWTSRQAKEGIVNQYYWSLGAIRQETEELAATRTVEVSGASNFTETLGLGYKNAMAWNVVSDERSVDFGQSTALRFSAAKKDEDNLTFSLNLTNNLAQMLDVFDPLSREWRLSPSPGQVSAYRTMAFYLPPDSANASAFVDIVDPAWWAHSNSSEAIALRGARLSGRGVRPFRVLYRVTHVERIPPEGSDLPDITADRVTAQPVDLDGNAILVDLLIRELADSTVPTLSALTQAVFAVLVGTAERPSPLSAILPWWAAFLVEAAGIDPDPASARQLAFLQLSMVDWFDRAFDSGQMPDGLVGRN